MKIKINLKDLQNLVLHLRLTVTFLKKTNKKFALVTQKQADELQKEINLQKEKSFSLKKK